MKILIALDESPVSFRAAREAVLLFPGNDVEFLVVNVARVPVPWVGAAGFGPGGVVNGGFGTVLTPDAEWQATLRDDDAIEERLRVDEAELEGLAERAGIATPDVIVEAGDPVERICMAADEHDVDVIVVGGHDKGLLGRIIDPSVSTGVIRGTHRPVLVVSGNEPPRA